MLNLYQELVDVIGALEAANLEYALCGVVDHVERVREWSGTAARCRSCLVKD